MGIAPFKAIVSFAEAAVFMKLIPAERIPAWKAVTEAPARPKPRQREARIAPSAVDVVMKEAVEDEEEEEEENSNASSDSSSEEESESESEEVAPLRKGKGRVAVVSSPEFVPEAGASQEVGAKRVLQESPSRVEAVAKRTRTGPSFGSAPLLTSGELDLGGVEVQEESVIAVEHVPAVKGMVSRGRFSSAHG